MPVIPPIPEGTSPAELVVDRINTQAMIAANPIALTLIPRQNVRTGSGTKYVDGVPRPIQIGRLIEQQGSNERADDGMQRKDSFQLLLAWDGEVELNDYWIDGDLIRNEVTGILPYNGYERRAEVTRYGQEGQPFN